MATADRSVTRITQPDTVPGESQLDMPIEATAPPAPPRRIRLLTVNSTLHIGGAEQVAADLAARVDAGRFRSLACYLKRPGHIADQMLGAGVELVPVPGLRPGRRDYLTFLKLRRLIRERDIQIIHTHDVHGMVDGSLCRLAMPGLRFVHTFHYGNYPVRRPGLRIIEKAFWRVSDALVAVSHTQKQSICDFYRVPDDRIQVIWNGVARPALPEKPLELLWPIPPATTVIGSVSTLIPQKGLEHLLAAADFLRRSGDRFVLLIAGDGQLRQELSERSRQLGLESCVQFLGWVPQASRHVLPACDIFVQSSLWEAMSVVVLEAMAAGKAMAVTSVGENSRVVIPEVTGLMVPPADPLALAEALRRLLRDPVLRERLGRQARARYEEHFTIGHMVQAYESLYARLLAGRR